jgi:hypothetical protein
MILQDILFCVCRKFINEMAETQNVTFSHMMLSLVETVTARRTGGQEKNYAAQVYYTVHQL